MRELREMLWSSSCSGRGGDLLLVSSDGVLHAHRLLIVAYLPSLAAILAPACDGKHELTTILLPDISLSMVKAALEDLYTREDPLKLANIFSDTSFIGSLDNLEQIFKKELNEIPEGGIDQSEHNKGNFSEVKLMNGNTVIQCQSCLAAVENVSDHVCENSKILQDTPDSRNSKIFQDTPDPRQALPDTQSEEIKLNFEEIVFKNDKILYRCLHCDSQFKRREDAGDHMKSHQNSFSTQGQAKKRKGSLAFMNRGSVKREERLLNNQFRCNSCDYKCASRIDMSKHEKKEHLLRLDISSTATTSFSIDHFIAKLNRKKEKIFVCRKCLKKCRGELGAKMHSKMKCGAKTNFILPKSSKVHKILKEVQKLPAFKNDVKEMLRARKSIEVTRATEFEPETKKIFQPGNCHICKKTFPSGPQLKSHIEQSHYTQLKDFELSFTKLTLEGGRQAYECKACGKKCTTVSGITRHQQKSSCTASKKVKVNKRSQPSGVVVSCDQCRKICTSNRYLDIHKRRKHTTFNIV